MTTAALTQIIDAPLPKFHANIRHLTRKEWAAKVRALLKELKITGVSVTAPRYSMAQSIDIKLPALDIGDDAHRARHAEIDSEWEESGVDSTGVALRRWNGYGASGCEHCKARGDAKAKICQIILAAFPDLDDRSEHQSDHFDFCFTVN